MHPTVSRVLLFLGIGTAVVVAAAGPSDDKPYNPAIKPASDEAVKALKRIRLPRGVEARVWAAEPLLANPVCFAFDEKGRCFVAETFRLHHGVTDNRRHRNWLDDDLASRTVADRVALYKKYLKDQFATCEIDHDRVRLLEDTRGGGVADKATVFADGFRHAADGLGAGVLARKGDVWYTCIPDLYLLRDTKGAGKADVKKSLATGFGVHVAFIGHDMHGLRMGPDGRLYFSIGDRGLNVTTREGKTLAVPDCGAVLRCEPDGSHLEVVATGLRNPQELAFDAHGNLFTVDNNSDSGDKARLVYVVEGGDNGWRTGYQYGSSMGDRGPFNAEKIWHLPHPEQPAYVVPPLAHLADGPSGLCFNYGATALPARYAGHFFLADFRGAPGTSGIRSFAVKPKGAAFEMVDAHEFIWSILATDCDFGPDGGFYVSDWVEGWDLTGKGRIYRFADADAAKKPAVAEVKKLLAEGFDRRSVAGLAKLLEHPDLRVRQEAQFALADRGKDAVPTLARVAKESKNQLARLHAVWGLGQIGRKEPRAALPAVTALLKDADAEVRAQAARVTGAASNGELTELLPLLKDGEPHVRFLAAQAVAAALGKQDPGRLGGADATWKAVVALLRENADADPYLRHAGVMALSRFPVPALARTAQDESAAVRLAGLLALRRRGSPEVAHFLADADPRLVVEAARAIHDEPIPAALPKLAALLARSNQSEFLLIRALNAHFRLGKKENAAAVAAFAGRAGAPEKLRVEAVKCWVRGPGPAAVTASPA
jgi:quinoprotein glucose dehydrogenase